MLNERQVFGLLLVVLPGVYFLTEHLHMALVATPLKLRVNIMFAKLSLWDARAQLAAARNEYDYLQALHRLEDEKQILEILQSAQK